MAALTCPFATLSSRVSLNFEIVYISPIPKFGQEDLIYNSLFCFVFFHPILSQSELSRTELPKCNHSAERFISTPLSLFISPSGYHPCTLETCNPPHAHSRPLDTTYHEEIPDSIMIRWNKEDSKQLI